MTQELPKLDYEYNALEPYIDAQTMEIHHSKHHQGYTDKFNAAVEGTELANKDPIEILKKLEDVPTEIKDAVRNNGGGFVNHSLFWKILTPGGKEPSDPFFGIINNTFGSMDEFKDKFTDAATKQFGSGWAWLVVKDGEMEIISTPNQDTPYSQGLTPILGLDVWEHAYYLKYQNKRPDYIKAFFNLINWEEVEKRFKDSTN
tara:strand:+ start:1727 stop:2332 length:606 start_codon:yes stop_codon:yes gene_type:complete